MKGVAEENRKLLEQEYVIFVREKLPEFDRNINELILKIKEMRNLYEETFREGLSQGLSHEDADYYSLVAGGKLKRLNETLKGFIDRRTYGYYHD